VRRLIDRQRRIEAELAATRARLDHAGLAVHANANGANGSSANGGGATGPSHPHEDETARIDT
jgi:hypothetical protein